jgi:hypothetical protein
MPSDATERLVEQATARRFASHGEERPKAAPQPKENRSAEAATRQRAGPAHPFSGRWR